MASTVDDKKKEVLYNMLGASDLYVYAETLLTPPGNADLVLSSSSVDDVIEGIATTMAQPEKLLGVFRRIDAMRTAAERRLVDVLSAISAPER